MIVRAAVIDDIERCVEMAAEFHKIAYGLVGVEFCPESTYNSFLVCLEHGLFCVADTGENVVGMAAGVKSPMIMNSAVTVGAELCWWVEPEHRNTSAGIKLLKFLEGQARNGGVDVWSMMLLESSNPEATANIYDKMGYVQSERAFIKVF